MAFTWTDISNLEQLINVRPKINALGTASAYTLRLGYL